MMIPIRLQSVQNIRDLGNTAMMDGRVIRPGCLIRSAHLANASDEDISSLQQTHRLQTIIDLRTHEERSELPDATPGLVHLDIPIFETFQAGITHEQNHSQAQHPDIRMIYRYMMQNSTAQQGFRRVLKHVFEHDYQTGAVLWHCTEGKDRCGMVTVLVLTALGADRDTILSDYLTTNETNKPKAEAMYARVAATQDEEAAAQVYATYIADESYLQAAWEVMGENYLEDVLGFSADDIMRFRDSVLA